MQEAEILAVCIGRVREYHDEQGPWRSAVKKSPLQGPGLLTRLGIQGDEQADNRHHGGFDKAVLAWPVSHYRKWEIWLGRSLEPGCFGENLLVEGLDEELVCLGDRWALCPHGHPLGEDPPVSAPVLEVSQPRMPCYKPGRLLGQPDLVHRMIEHGHTGWYLRVLVTGPAQAGARLQLLQRPHPDWTISRCWKAYLSRDTHPQEWRELRRLPELAEAWRG